MTNQQVLAKLIELIKEKKSGWDSQTDSLILNRFYKGSREVYTMKHIDFLLSIVMDETNE